MATGGTLTVAGGTLAVSSSTFATDDGALQSAAAP
jgi:hypothetical protein